MKLHKKLKSNANSTIVSPDLFIDSFENFNGKMKHLMSLRTLTTRIFIIYDKYARIDLTLVIHVITQFFVSLLFC